MFLSCEPKQNISTAFENDNLKPSSNSNIMNLNVWTPTKEKLE